MKNLWGVWHQRTIASRTGARMPCHYESSILFFQQLTQEFVLLANDDNWELGTWELESTSKQINSKQTCESFFLGRVIVIVVVICGIFNVHVFITVWKDVATADGTGSLWPWLSPGLVTYFLSNHQYWHLSTIKHRIRYLEQIVSRCHVWDQSQTRSSQGKGVRWQTDSEKLCRNFNLILLLRFAFKDSESVGWSWTVCREKVLMTNPVTKAVAT